MQRKSISRYGVMRFNLCFAASDREAEEDWLARLTGAAWQNTVLFHRKRAKDPGIIKIFKGVDG
jgi:hypothetical protein